ncbi:hypothetical protein ASG41_13920 [Modestobacter sp. Leaf380]|nr:hypothetical protein ASG41_13920 [Modestobacter sp. Leaf380]
MAYLHRLPVDEVKFDRALITGINSDPAAVAIVRHSIRLAHELGCDSPQGYLTGRPQPIDEWFRLARKPAPLFPTSATSPLLRGR